MQRICSVDECSSPATGRGWCRAHYQRWLKYGIPTGGQPRYSSVAERFFAQVDTDGAVPAHMQHLGKCWLWTGSKRAYYGRMQNPTSESATHRLSYALAHGSVPPGLWVLHRCDTPLCVNPAHLWAGTPLDNAVDRDTKGRNNVPRGIGHSFAKVTDEAVRAIRAEYAAGGSGHRGRRGAITYSNLAVRYGISPAVVGRIVRRERWTHV